MRRPRHPSSGSVAPASEATRVPDSRPAGLFMALFLAAALTLSLMNPALLHSPEEPLLDGSWSAAYQEAFDRASPLYEPATNAWAAIEYVLFREGRRGVLVGTDDWLYSAEEFAYPSDPAQAEAQLRWNAELVAEVGARLAEGGATLVVALVPAKARIHPEHLGRYVLPSGPLERYDAARAALDELGVVSVDLRRPLLAAREEAPAFLRTDTHWTPAGASAAAEAVAARVAELRDFSWLGATTYSTAMLPPEEHRGDLANFLPLGPLYDSLGPADDRLAGAVTESTEAAGNDLFATVDIPVVLVGTSYSADARWNFAGALREALGADVLEAAESGRGPYRPMIDYLEGEAFRSTPPDVVVWEIPERYLTVPWSDDAGATIQEENR